MLMCYDQIILLVLIKAKYTSILLVRSIFSLYLQIQEFKLFDGLNICQNLLMKN